MVYHYLFTIHDASVKKIQKYMLLLWFHMTTSEMDLLLLGFIWWRVADNCRSKYIQSKTSGQINEIRLFQWLVQLFINSALWWVCLPGTAQIAQGWYSSEDKSGITTEVHPSLCAEKTCFLLLYGARALCGPKVSGHFPAFLKRKPHSSYPTGC